MFHKNFHKNIHAHRIPSPILTHSNLNHIHLSFEVGEKFHMNFQQTFRLLCVLVPNKYQIK